MSAGKKTLSIVGASGYAGGGSFCAWLFPTLTSR